MTEIEIIKELIECAEDLQYDFGKNCQGLLIEANKLMALKQGQTLPLHNISVTDLEIDDRTKELYDDIDVYQCSEAVGFDIGAKWMRDELTSHSR